MLERDSPSRSHSVPLGHKFLAVLFAVAVAFGAHAWLTRNAGRSAAAAELSFDAKTARHIDPGLGDAAQPAIAAAQSILSDREVAGLSKQAWLSSSGMTTRIGEFRSRLELTQPSPRVLDVRFHDADPAKSVATANAIAEALAAWSPSFSAPAANPALLPSAPPAAPTTAAAPPAAPVKKPAPPPLEQASSGLAAALGQLEDRLSSTERELQNLGASREAHGRSSEWDLPSYAQSREQQLIKSRVREAEQQLHDLRAQYPREDRLAALQQDLSSVLPEKLVGVSAARLRQERTQLTSTIASIDSARLAIQHEEAAHAAPATSDAAQTPAPPVSESNIGQQAGQQDAASPEPPPASAPSPALTAQSEPGPLTVVRLAGSPAPVTWWPSAAAGLLVGILYLSIVALRYRQSGDYSIDSEEAPASHGTRFITPDAPTITHDSPEGEYARLVPHDAAPQRANFSWDPAPEPARDTSSRRASFSYEPEPHPASNGASATESRPDRSPQSENGSSPNFAPCDSPVAGEPAATFDPAETSSATHSSGEVLRSDPSSEAALPPQRFPAAYAVAESIPEPPGFAAPPRGSGSMLTDPPREPAEKVMPMWDSWADNLIKSLSQTEIGRMFEGSSESDPGSSDPRPLSPHRSTRDRLAG